MGLIPELSCLHGKIHTNSLDWNGSYLIECYLTILSGCFLGGLVKKNCHHDRCVGVPLGARCRSVTLTTHNSFTSYLLFKLLKHTKNQSRFWLWFFSLLSRMDKHG